MIDPSIYPRDVKYYKNRSFIWITGVLIVIVGLSLITSFFINRNNIKYQENYTNEEIKKEKNANELLDRLHSVERIESQYIIANGIEIPLGNGETQVVFSNENKISRNYSPVAAINFCNSGLNNFVVYAKMKRRDESFQQDIDSNAFNHVDVEKNFTSTTRYNKSGLKINTSIGHGDKYYLAGIVENENTILVFRTYSDSKPTEKDNEYIDSILENVVLTK